MAQIDYKKNDPNILKQKLYMKQINWSRYFIMIDKKYKIWK